VPKTIKIQQEYNLMVLGWPRIYHWISTTTLQVARIK